jgi:hypothetical protein
MGFDPYHRALKIRESIWDSNSEHGNSLGSVRVYSLTLFTFPGASDVTLGPLFRSTTLPWSRPRLGLQHIWTFENMVKFEPFKSS